MTAEESPRFEGRAYDVHSEHARQLSDLRDDVDDIRATLHGSEGNLGLTMKVEVIWRTYVWLVGLVGAMAGSAATALAYQLAG